MENNYRFFGTPRVKGFDSAGRVGVAKEKINNFLTRANMGDTISERDWKYLQRQQLIPLVRSVGQENPTAGRLLQSAARMLSRYTDNPKRQYVILKKAYYEVSSALYGMRQGGKSAKANPVYINRALALAEQLEKMVQDERMLSGMEVRQLLRACRAARNANADNPELQESERLAMGLIKINHAGSGKSRVLRMLFETRRALIRALRVAQNPSR